jgi:hypothetical protein
MRLAQATRVGPSRAACPKPLHLAPGANLRLTFSTCGDAVQATLDSKPIHKASLSRVAFYFADNSRWSAQQYALPPLPGTRLWRMVTPPTNSSAPRTLELGVDRVFQQPQAIALIENLRVVKVTGPFPYPLRECGKKLQSSANLQNRVKGSSFSEPNGVWAAA